jgi:hypothetical protein
MTAFVTHPCSPANMEQLEMHFDPARGPKLPLGPQRYRFTKDALVVDYDGRQLLFGLWNRLHGFWRVEGACGQAEEALPHWWRPLNEQGVWSLSPDAPNSQVGFIPKAGKRALRHEANAAFVAYFDSIPKRIRRLVGGLEDYQWLALDLIWQVPEFATFLDDEIHEKRIQYFFACCALASIEKGSRAERREFARSVMGTRRPQLLARLSGIKCTKSTIRILSKLGKRAHGADCYRALLSAALDPPAAKIFAHAAEIKPSGIETWMGLPEPARLPNLLGIIIAEPDISEELGEIVRQIPADMPSIWYRLGQSLSRLRAGNEIAEWCQRWEDRILDEVNFPEAPFSGCRRLRPLSSGQDMRREGREMRNCLGDLIGDALWGRAYYYHWGGAQPATVMLETCPERGWRVGRILGPGNEEIDTGLAGHIAYLIGQRLHPTPTEIPLQSSREMLISCMPTN